MAFRALMVERSPPIRSRMVPNGMNCRAASASPSSACSPSHCHVGAPLPGLRRPGRRRPPGCRSGRRSRATGRRPWGCSARVLHLLARLDDDLVALEGDEGEAHRHEHAPEPVGGERGELVQLGVTGHRPDAAGDEDAEDRDLADCDDVARLPRLRDPAEVDGDEDQRDAAPPAPCAAARRRARRSPTPRCLQRPARGRNRSRARRGCPRRRGRTSSSSRPGRRCRRAAPPSPTGTRRRPRGSPSPARRTPWR